MTRAAEENMFSHSWLSTTTATALHHCTQPTRGEIFAYATWQRASLPRPNDTTQEFPRRRHHQEGPTLVLGMRKSHGS